MTLQCSLDLAGFDPKSPNLHLIVDAAEEVEIAVRAPSDKVAGLVETSSRQFGEGVGNKALRGQFARIEIPKRDAIAADVELAGNTDRCKPRRLRPSDLGLLG